MKLNLIIFVGDDDEAALLNGTLPVDVRVEGVLPNHPALGDAAREVLSRLLDYLTHKPEIQTPKGFHF